MQVFTLYDCDNITNSYVAHYKQKQIAAANRTVWTGPKIVLGSFTTDEGESECECDIDFSKTFGNFGRLQITLLIEY